MDLKMRLFLFIFLLDVTQGASQLIENNIVADADQDDITSIRRKRGVVKEVLEVGGKLIMRSKMIWRAWRAKRILLRDAKPAPSEFDRMIYTKPGGEIRAIKDWFDINPPIKQHLDYHGVVIWSGKVGKYDLTKGYRLKGNSRSHLDRTPEISMTKNPSPHERGETICVIYEDY